jgi:hypothetical protein
VPLFDEIRQLAADDLEGGYLQKFNQTPVAEENRAIQRDRQRGLVHGLDDDAVYTLHAGERKDLLSLRPLHDKCIDLASADRLQRLLGLIDPGMQRFDFGKQLLPRALIA